MSGKIRSLEMQNIEFVGKDKFSGVEVRGWYWENQGIGYIITKDELIQPPLRRTYIVDRDTVEVIVGEEENE